MTGRDRCQSRSMMTVRPRRRSGVKEFDVGDGLVLRLLPLPGASGRAVALNETSRAIWRICDGQHSVRDIVAVLGARYDCDEDCLEKDVVRALTELRSAGVLHLGGGEPAGSSNG
jgi:hypothetical protein